MINPITINTDLAIKKVQLTLDKFKPVAEEICNFKLKDLNVEYHQYWNSINIHDDFFYSKGIVLITKNPTEILASDLLEINVAHELGHYVSTIINPVFEEPWNYRSNDHLHLTKILTIAEGFAEYFSLDLFPKDLLSKEGVERYKQGLLNDVFKLRRYNELELYNGSIYGLGYKLFNLISNRFGKEEVFDIIEYPQISLFELIGPERYYTIKRKDILSLK